MLGLAALLAACCCCHGAAGLELGQGRLSPPRAAREEPLSAGDPGAASILTVPDKAEQLKNDLAFYKPSHRTKSRVAQRALLRSVREILADAPQPKITILPWGQLITLSKVNLSLGKGGEGDYDLPPHEMMEVMQQFIDYVTDDNFIQNFNNVASGYRDTGATFRNNASLLLSDFMNATQDVERSRVMHKSIKFLDANAILIHKFVKEMKEKMSDFVKSMPTGLFQETVNVLPMMDNVTRLIDRPGAAKGHRRSEDLNDPEYFCTHLEPLFNNSMQAVGELEDMIVMVNDSQQQIPVIGQFMDAILPDTPEGKAVSPRVKMLEQELLDTVYSIVFSLHEVAESYDRQVGRLLHSRLNCNTQRDAERSAGLLPRAPGLAALLTAAAAMALPWL